MSCGRQRPPRLLALQRSSSLVGLSEPGIVTADDSAVDMSVVPRSIVRRVNVEKLSLLQVPGTTTLKKCRCPRQL